MKIYYAHSKNLYDTPTEKRDILMLAALGFDVVNPNELEHQRECMKWANVMLYFYTLVAQCDALAFRGLASGEIPAGVAGEIQEALQHNLPVIELPTRVARRSLSIEETREYFRCCGER